MKKICFEANALDLVAQSSHSAASRLRPARCRSVGCARQAGRVWHQALRVGVGVSCPRRHGFDDFDDADAGLPCAAGRSMRARLSEKIDVHLLAANQPFGLGNAEPSPDVSGALVVVWWRA